MLFRHCFLNPCFVRQRRQRQFFLTHSNREISARCLSQHWSSSEQTLRAERARGRVSREWDTFFGFVCLFFPRLRRRSRLLRHAPIGLYPVDRIAAFSTPCILTYIYLGAVLQIRLPNIWVTRTIFWSLGSPTVSCLLQHGPSISADYLFDTENKHRKTLNLWEKKLNTKKHPRIWRKFDAKNTESHSQLRDKAT